jgi:hypothetical protein
MRLSFAVLILFVSAVGWCRSETGADKIAKAAAQVRHLERVVNKDQETVDRNRAAVMSDRRTSQEYEAQLLKAQKSGDGKTLEHFLRLSKRQAVKQQADTTRLRKCEATLARDRFHLRRARRTLRDLRA